MGLGILALTWPQTVQSGTTMPGVYEKYRVHIPEGHIFVAPDGAGRMSDEFMNELVSEVEQRHAAALLRRRRILMDGLTSELQRVGIAFGGVSEWSLVANTDGRNGQAGDRVISITPRAPEVPDLFALDTGITRYGIANAKGVLIHTVPVMADQDSVYLKWAIADRNLTLVASDQIVAFVESL
jgi:hypothetical protein